MARYVVFDLDDTLVVSSRRKSAVPRQTRHLRRLAAHRELAIVSYNCMASFFAAAHGLSEHVPTVLGDGGDRVNGSEPEFPRADLVGRALERMGYDGSGFEYYDDRRDNVDEIRCRFPDSKAVWVEDPYRLHELFRTPPQSFPPQNP